MKNWLYLLKCFWRNIDAQFSAKYDRIKFFLAILETFRHILPRKNGNFTRMISFSYLNYHLCYFMFPRSQIKMTFFFSNDTVFSEIFRRFSCSGKVMTWTSTNSSWTWARSTVKSSWILAWTFCENLKFWVTYRFFFKD